jgi:hypothetical protein
MNSPASIVIRDSRLEPAARCVVCGNDIPAGEGLTASFGDQTLRFKCPGCLGRFKADPTRYLGGHEAGCCGPEREGSPPSEWRCD